MYNFITVRHNSHVWHFTFSYVIFFLGDVIVFVCVESNLNVIYIWLVTKKMTSYYYYEFFILIYLLQLWIFFVSCFFFYERLIIFYSSVAIAKSVIRFLLFLPWAPGRSSVVLTPFFLLVVVLFFFPFVNASRKFSASSLSLFEFSESWSAPVNWWFNQTMYSTV